MGGPSVSVPRIFVSHSHKDDEFTQRLVSDLHAAGAEVWVDVAGISHGNFMQRIDEALQRCEWMVLVLTPNAIASQYVKDEVYTALHRVMQGYMRAVIPVLAAPCARGSIPPQWDALHRYDATTNYSDAFARLLDAVRAPEVDKIPPSVAPTAASDDTPTYAQVLPDQAMGRKALPPRLSIAPLRLNAGFLDVNDMISLRLKVNNLGGGELEGRTETNFPGLHVEPKVITADTTELLVHIDTRGLPDGPYICHLAARTNGGEQIVQVRFIVKAALSKTSGSDSISRISAT